MLGILLPLVIIGAVVFLIADLFPSVKDALQQSLANGISGAATQAGQGAASAVGNAAGGLLDGVGSALTTNAPDDYPRNSLFYFPGPSTISAFFNSLFGFGGNSDTSPGDAGAFPANDATVIPLSYYDPTASPDPATANFMNWLRGQQS